MQFSTDNYLHHFRLIERSELPEILKQENFMTSWGQGNNLQEFISRLKIDIEANFTRHRYVLKYILQTGRNFTAYFARI